MPELPEVETVCTDLRDSAIIGSLIVAVDVLWERTIGMMDADTFRKRLVGRKFLTVSRRGKFLVLGIDDGSTLLIHLRMSGSLVLMDNPDTPDDHDRVIIRFDAFSLRFHDPRKFGRMILTDEPGHFLGRLGPEPLSEDLDAVAFHHMLLTRRGRVKALLLDQHFIAGIGNIYADESLFIARLHPCRIACTLSAVESARLLSAIRQVLSAGIAHRGTSLGDGESNFKSDGSMGSHGNSLSVFGRTGRQCPRCSSPIERTIVAQRSTHFCPHCQPLQP